MNTLIILADLGKVRAFQVNITNPSPVVKRNLHEIKSAAFDYEASSLGESVTDKAGRFSQGNMAGMTGGMSYGEEHEVKNEMEKRNIALIAGQINQIIAKEGFPPCLLAAPGSILKRLEVELSDDVLDSIQETVAADLTKESIKDLEKRFLR
jgi:Protein required for attachment to host cells